MKTLIAIALLCAVNAQAQSPRPADETIREYLMGGEIERAKADILALRKDVEVQKIEIGKLNQELEVLRKAQDDYATALQTLSKESTTGVQKIVTGMLEEFKSIHQQIDTIKTKLSTQ